jgi:hypothetical protein
MNAALAWLVALALLACTVPADERRSGLDFMTPGHAGAAA